MPTLGWRWQGDVSKVASAVLPEWGVEVERESCSSAFISLRPPVLGHHPEGWGFLHPATPGKILRDEGGAGLVWLSSHLSLSPGVQIPPLPFQPQSFFLLLQRGGNETVPVGRSLSTAPSPTQLGDSSVSASRIRTWMLSEASSERLRASLPWLKKGVTPAQERLLGDHLPVYLPIASGQR